MTVAAPQFPVPVTAPPSWLPLLEPGDEGSGGLAREGSIPGAGWPPIETIDYLSKLIILLLLILALPALIDKLFTNPRGISSLAAATRGA